MKMKKWAKLIAFILCIVMALSLFVACDNDENNGSGNGGGATPPDESIDVATAMEDILTKITSSYKFDGSKDIMVDVAGVVDYRKIDADGYVSTGNTYNKNTDFAWQVIVRGNVSMNWESTDAQNYYLLEINDLVRETSVLQLYFEYQDKAVGENGETLVHNGSYIYASILGSDVVKINAFSMMQLVKQLVPGFGGEVAAADGLGDMDIMELLPTVAGMIFDEKVEFDGKSYTFTADINKVWELIYGLLSDGSTIEGAIGADLVTQVNDVIKELFGDLTYTEKGNDEAEVIVNVNDIATLVKYIDINMPKIGAKIKFDFTDKGIFKGLAASINVDPQGDDKGFIAGANFNALSVTNATYDKVEMLKGTFIEKAYVKAENRLTVEGFNLLKFQINGEVIAGGRNPVQINADINPFVLLNGLTMDNIKDLGYINITLDSENVDPMYGKRLLTLHCDFSTGRAIISLVTAGTSGTFGKDHIYFGGVYEFEAIAAAFSHFGGETNNVSKADEVPTTQDVLMEFVSKVVENLDYSNLAENGLVFKDLRNSIIYLLHTLLPDLAGYDVGGLIAGHLLVWGDTLALKVNSEDGFVFGACEKVSEADLDLIAFHNPKTALIKADSNPTTDAIKKVYEYGEEFNISTRAEAHYRLFPINGVNVQGAEMTTDAVYSFYTGYDPCKIGKQTVTVYYGMPTKLSKIFSAFIVGSQIKGFVDINWPLYGCQTMEIEVEVLAPSEAGSEMVILNGSSVMETGSNIAEMLDGVIRYRSGSGNYVETKITNDMIFCDKPVIDSFGNISYNGTWNIEIRKIAADGTTVVKVPMVITSFGIQANIVEETFFGEDLADKFNVSKTIVDENGNQVVEKINFTIKSAKYINSSGTLSNVTLSSLFNAGTTVTKYYSTYNDRVVIITIEAEVDDVKVTRTISTTMRRDENYLDVSSGRNSSYFYTNTKIDTLYKSFAKANTTDRESYDVRYNTETNKWELSKPNIIVDEEGNLISATAIPYLKNYDLKVKITRTKNASGATVSETVDMAQLNGYLTVGTYKIEVDLNGFAYSTNITVKALLEGKNSTSSSPSSMFTLGIDCTGMEGTDMSEHAYAYMSFREGPDFDVKSMYVFAYGSGDYTLMRTDDLYYTIDWYTKVAGEYVKVENVPSLFSTSGSFVKGQTDVKADLKIFVKGEEVASATGYAKY